MRSCILPTSFKGSCDFVHYPLETSSHVVCKKSHNEKTVTLKQKILAAIASIVIGIGKMEPTVDLHGKSLSLAKKVNFHIGVGTKWNVKATVERKNPFRLGKPVQKPKEKPFCRTPRPIVRLGTFQCRVHKKVCRHIVTPLPTDTPN